MLRLFSSLKLTLILLVVFALAIAAATFIEARYGAEGARALVYNAKWFEAVLVLLVLNLILLLFARAPYRGEQTGFLIIHVSIIVILVGAGMTRWFGYEGVMSIREGQSSSTLISVADYVQLKGEDGEALWPLRLYKPGPTNLSRGVRLGGERFRLEVREYWPHFEEARVAGAGGRPALDYAVAVGEGMERGGLWQGESAWAGPVRISFLDGEFPVGADGAPLGELEIRLRGESGRLPVDSDASAEIELAGHRFRVTEFHADYARRMEDPSPDDMRNPMIRVAVTGPEGPLGERILFAFFPDFSMGHGGGEDPLEGLGLEMAYRFERGLQLARGEDGLLGRADFPLERGGMDGGAPSETIPADSVFPIEEGALLRGEGFTFAVLVYLPEAVMTVRASEDSRRPAAARVALVDPSGEETEALLVRGATQARIVELAGREFSLSYGPQRIQLPYRIHLDDFILLTYPGSQNPAGFESHVRLFDDEEGIDGRPVRIHMNHPLNHRGNKHFQSSYDPDRLGTVLSVNHDPGRLPTYAGYVLITLGFALVFAKRLIWRRPAKERA